MPCRTETGPPRPDRTVWRGRGVARYLPRLESGLTGLPLIGSTPFTTGVAHASSHLVLVSPAARLVRDGTGPRDPIIVLLPRAAQARLLGLRLHEFRDLPGTGQRYQDRRYARARSGRLGRDGERR